MKNAADTAYHGDEDEEGVADGAASLGADGGPAGGSSNIVTRTNDLEEFEDQSWLDEELSDEELAALGDEELADDDLSDAAFDEFDVEADAFDDTAVEAAFEAREEFDDAEFDVDASFDEGADNFDYDPQDAEYDDVDAELYEAQDPQDAGEVEPESETHGALVATGGTMVDVHDHDVSDIGGEEIDHRPVPRISIHAFCESPTTTALLEKASVDRRLSKTHMTIHMGGISKAVDQFQTAATPNLIILETLAGGSEIFSQLNELAEVCDPSTKVVVVGQVNDIILYRELIRQGVSEYLVRPQSPLAIIKTIADLYIDPSAPPIGRTVAFVGARGGVGSSTLAHNVGWCTAEEYKSDTVILDLDLPFGTASLDFDQDASAGLVEALSSPERLDDVLLDRLLQKHTDRLSLFTAPSMLDRDFDIDDQAFETVLDVVRNTAPTIIVDVPHIWTSWAKRILTTADEIVVTAAPDLASFRNTKNLIDILSGTRPNDASPTLVLNMFDAKLSAVQPSQFAEHVGIEPAQVLTWEPQLFGSAATNAAPIIDVGPKSKTAQSIRELSAQVLGRNEANIVRPKFSLASLFKK